MQPAVGTNKLFRGSLKNHGADELVEDMFAMGAETMALPMEEKMKYEQGDGGLSCGSVACTRYLACFLTLACRYKKVGANATDETGALDTVEFINIAKDDALAWPQIAHRTYPSTVNARMDSTIKPFVRKSIEINNTLLGVLNDRLGVQRGRSAVHQVASDARRVTRV